MSDFERRDAMSDHTPTSGSEDPRDTEITPEEEPRATGTLFLVMIILMIIGAVWMIMYVRVIGQ